MSAAPDSAQRPFYLRDNFAPVMEEVDAFDLPCTGAIPPELRGLYLRNGPNQRAGDPGHWFIGDGMIHGVRLERGKALWFRNRWVRTRAFVEGAELVDANGNVDHSVAKANTNVIGFGGRLFALVESSFPTELTPELDTVGVCDFGGRLTTSMTAHPKIDPATGELHFFGYGFLPPYLTYHRVDAAGTLVQSEVIEVRGPTMIHDFAITEHNVIFMDLPIVFSFERAMRRAGFPYEWSDDYGARLGVMPRGGQNESIRWFEIAPCYVFHPLNAFEQDNTIVMDVVRYEELWRGGPDAFTSAFLHRWTIDLTAGTVRERRLDDRPIEFPRVDDRRIGRAHRYGYAVTNAATVGDRPNQLVKYDLATGVVETHDFGPGRQPAESVFVPSAARAAEDEGFVLGYVYDAGRNGSDLVILDAQGFAGPALATIRLPQRVPFGFHGNWIADPA